MVNMFFHHLWHYSVEIVPALLLGFFLSGLAHEFIPQRWVDKNLGKPGIRPILISTLVGTILPLCCWGSLPVAIGFYKKGARLGPVLAFLMATPATSLSALLVTYNVLGAKFAIYIFFAVILMGVMIGIVGNSLVVPHKKAAAKDTCPHCHAEGEARGGERNFWVRVKSVLKFAYIDMPKELGRETAIGIALAALVASYVPLGELISRFLWGAWGYLFSLTFGLATYVCSTATVPLTDALIQQGLSIGAAMVMMLAGPVTSYGTILVMKKEFGGKILFIYVFLVSIISLLFGYVYSLI